MTTTSTVLQIKEATLALSRIVPCANITVSMVIQKVNIARSTFYKYFQNMTKVWHAITHDLMCSISTQMDQLYISSMHHFNDIQRQKILTFAELSPLTMASYFSEFFMRNSHVIHCLLIENMDPLFLVHWRNMTNEIFFCKMGMQRKMYVVLQILSVMVWLINAFWLFKEAINKCCLTIIWLQIKFFTHFVTKKNYWSKCPNMYPVFDKFTAFDYKKEPLILSKALFSF